MDFMKRFGLILGLALASSLGALQSVLAADEDLKRDRFGNPIDGGVNEGDQIRRNWTNDDGAQAVFIVPTSTITPSVTPTVPFTFTGTVSLTLTPTETPTITHTPTQTPRFATPIATPTIAVQNLWTIAGAYGSAGTTEISTNTQEYGSVVLICQGLTGAATLQVYETAGNPVTGTTGLAPDFTFDNSQASWATAFNTAPIGLFVRPVTVAAGVTVRCDILGRPR